MFNFTSSALFLVNPSGMVSILVKHEEGWYVDYTGTNKVSTVRMCLKAFKEAQKHHDYMWCTAYSLDGYGDTRIQMYKKMGFTHQGKFDEDGSPILEFGRGVAPRWERWKKSTVVHRTFISKVIMYLKEEGYSYKESNPCSLTVCTNGTSITVPIKQDWYTDELTIKLGEHTFSSSTGHTLLMGEICPVTPLREGEVYISEDMNPTWLEEAGWAEAQRIPKKVAVFEEDWDYDNLEYDDE